MSHCHTFSFNQSYQIKTDTAINFNLNLNLNMNVKVTLTIPNVLFLPFHFAINYILCYILQAGPTYGRKMMTGYLRQKLGTAIG